MRARAHGFALMLVLDVGDPPQQLLEIVDRSGLFLGQRYHRTKMRQQHDEGIADAAQLLTVTRHSRERISLDGRLARLANCYVDRSQMAPHRRHERRPW